MQIDTGWDKRKSKVLLKLLSSILGCNLTKIDVWDDEILTEKTDVRTSGSFYLKDYIFGHCSCYFELNQP